MSHWMIGTVRSSQPPDSRRYSSSAHTVVTPPVNIISQLIGRPGWDTALTAPRERLPGVGGEVGPQILAVDLFFAAVADRDRLEHVTAVLVHELQGRVIDLVAVPPAQHGQQHRVEILALLRQDVLIARGPFLIGPSLQNPLVNEQLQPVGQDVAAELELGLDVLEPPHAAKALAQDYHGPALADHRPGPGDGAFLLRQLRVSHAVSIPSQSRIMTEQRVSPRPALSSPASAAPDICFSWSRGRLTC